VLAIISYSIPFYRPRTLQHVSRLDSKTFLTEYGRFFLLTVDVFSVDVISVDFFSYIQV